MMLCNRKVPACGIILLGGTITSRCLRHGRGPAGTRTGISPAECQLAGLVLLELRAIHAAISHSLTSECSLGIQQHVGPVLVYFSTPSFCNRHICLLACQEKKSFHQESCYRAVARPDIAIMRHINSVSSSLSGKALTFCNAQEKLQRDLIG